MKEEEIIAKLSHSYFSYILREVEPFLEYFNNDDLKGCFHVDKIDSEILERLFFMASITSSDLSLPFNFSYDKSNHKIKKPEWLTDVKPFGSKSKQGVVTKSLIFNKFHIVTKRSKSSKFDEITIRDFCVGIHLNKILNEAPFFVRTLGCFQYKNRFHIATEFIDGINLKTFIQNKTNGFIDFLNIFFQILLGLEIAQNKLNFSHYDLHTDNVILVHQKNAFEISLYGYQYTIKHNYKPVLIDFGLSSIHTKGQTLGQKNLETKGIYNHLSHGYDIYVFLLFCIDTAQNKNTSIFKGIKDLLLFFKLETDIPTTLLTNNHIASLQKGIHKLIPNQFIKYLVRNYSGYLNVEIEPKKYNVDVLGKEPTFLKLKKIFDTKDELEPLNIPNFKKGFAKTLIGNIKIYYWYKDKIILEQDEIKKLIKIDKENLTNLIDDLNLKIYEKEEEEPKISVEQKNLFFVGLDYYYLILELELDTQYSFYKTWLSDFKATLVYKNIFKQLNAIMYSERFKRLPKKE